MKRVQLFRNAGWRLPPNTVSVAYPSRWQNPFRPPHREPAANHAAVRRFARYLDQHPDLVADAREVLAGKDLACWCPPALECHGDEWIRRLGSHVAAVD